MLHKFLLLVAISFSFQAFSQGSGVTDEQLQLNTITTSMPFLSIVPESRGGAMGDAGTALSANSTSIFWNTAMLNFSDDDAEVSVSYTPWLRKLTNDIHLSYVSGYKRLGDRQAIAASLRYFSLGEITFTNADASVIREDKPNEFEIAFGYAFKLSARNSIGINGKFAYSNLTGGLVVAGAQTKAGVAGIADISYAYRNEDINWFGYNGVIAFGTTINNIGNKIAYSELAVRDFLPMNLKIGSAYTAELDKYNKLTYSLEIQKLLVPTPPITQLNTSTNEYELISGKNNDVGVIAGLVQSFYDAPGRVQEDENGDYVQNSDGSYAVVKGTKFKEELSEINIATGLEYWYNNVFALRGGFFYESKNKGDRKFFTAGIAIQYNIFGLDISYLAALKRDNPLANTLRFTLRFKLGQKVAKESETPE
ncbi:MAG TPA: type IX secretion system outer membrane channel protein PorV [Fluviicola sp.]|nr:type IX secretion system outer membrane channel protein PorV [Fluviicola sp.]